MSINPNDIPEAFRDRPALKKPAPAPPFSAKPLLPWLGLSLLAALAAGSFILWREPPAPPQSQEPSPSPTAVDNTPVVENVLGHLPYAVAPERDLTAISRDGILRLRTTAAESFLKMQAAAKAQGIILNPISGFRTKAEQNHLFFEVKQQRNQDTSQRAEVSAPPGYSEHHTGYALDIGDGSVPATNLSPNFEKTAAFQWLKDNAHRYSFEMSFALHNVQGVSYEPWHWRFVGDSDSLETFYKARQLPPKP
jgi:D-alanyl-D-alanine carboxypeptidase